jgi:hypothetical protein
VNVGVRVDVVVRDGVGVSDVEHDVDDVMLCISDTVNVAEEVSDWVGEMLYVDVIVNEAEVVSVL